MQLCDRCVAGKLVHAVAVQPGVEVEAHDDRIVVRRDGDAGEPEYDHVELQIVPDLEDRCVLAQRLQPRERLGPVDLHRRFGEQVGRAVAQRDVARLVGAQGERHADQIAARRVGAGRLGIDRDPALVLRRRDPAVERRGIDHRLVSIVVAGGSASNGTSAGAATGASAT